MSLSPNQTFCQTAATHRRTGTYKFSVPQPEATMSLLSIKARSLTLLCFSQIAVLSLWFSASAVAPALARDFALSGDKIALLSSSVQAGFVIGCLISAALGLADRTDPRLLYALCALVGALANYAFIHSEPGSPLSVALRLLTGAVIAGVYPVGMKIAMSWAKGDAGLLVGMLVGSLMIGSASPHLIAFAGDVDWRAVLVTTSWISAVGGLSVMLVAIGPGFARSPKFQFGLALEAIRNKPIRLANFGYFGHMWEVYAMWAWIGLYLSASFEASGLDEPHRWASLMAFFTIAAGAPVSMIGGPHRRPRRPHPHDKHRTGHERSLLPGHRPTVWWPDLCRLPYCHPVGRNRFAGQCPILHRRGRIVQAGKSRHDADHADRHRLFPCPCLCAIHAPLDRPGWLALGLHTSGGWPDFRNNLNAETERTPPIPTIGGRPQIGPLLQRKKTTLPKVCVVSSIVASA